MRKNKIISLLMVFTLVMTSFFIPAKITNASDNASGYNLLSAYELYNQLDKKQNASHSVFVDGHIYFATKAKQARNPSGTRYRSLGYTISVTDLENLITIEVDKNGSYMKTPTNAKEETVDGYVYGIKCISYDDIQKLCVVAYGDVAKQIFSQKTILIQLDAIMTVIKGGEAKGEILGGDGDIALRTKGDIYRLCNPAELKALRAIFTSHDFKAFKEIYEPITNQELTITYQADYVDTTSSSQVQANKNYAIGTDNIITLNDDTYKEKLLQFQTLAVPHPTNSFGLEKTGYHLPLGEEWISSRYGTPVVANKQYHADELNDEVRSGPAKLTLIANWQPNTYELIYEGNGADKTTMGSENLVYDGDWFIPLANSFVRTGYTFAGWMLSSGEAAPSTGEWIPVPITADMVEDKSCVDANGHVAPGTKLKNLTTEDNKTLFLVAQWIPNDYKITLNPNLPNGRESETDYTKFVWLEYDNKYSLIKDGDSIKEIVMPKVTGYHFRGYTTGVFNTAFLVLPSSPLLQWQQCFSKTTLFTSNVELLGWWEPKEVTVTLNADTTDRKETPATQTVTATFDSVLPGAQFPYCNGYTFGGFYTEENGGGKCYYNNMMIAQVSDLLEDTTLYANWIDGVAPTVEILLESSTWTNSNDNGDTDDGYKVEIHATDIASGIERVEIYRENATTGQFEEVYTSYAYGALDWTIPLTEWEEGAIRYKAVAYDVAGNESLTVYNTVYYDKTSPNILNKDSDDYDITDLSYIKGTIQATDNIYN